jgi:hypothetical protein
MSSTQSQASAVTLPAFDPTDGTTPVTLPTQDPCCQAPCDPPWITKAACVTFTETKTSVVDLDGKSATSDVARGFVIVNVTYTYTFCLVGKQHGGLAYTLTLLPGEKMTLYHSDRYRRTTPTCSARSRSAATRTPRRFPRRSGRWSTTTSATR